jgi:hypothetical protein
VLQFILSTTGHTSNLQFGDCLLSRRKELSRVSSIARTAQLLTGVQGAAEVRALRAGSDYLDAVDEEAMCLLNNFLHLEAVRKKVGLELNRPNCEVVGHTGHVHIIRH